MILSRLPITLKVEPLEPAFSLLARNAEANGRRTLAELCSATGMEKNALCTGDFDQIERLAALTACDATALRHQSPHQVDRKYTDLLGQRFLSRSIRKDDLAICPRCWLEQGRDHRMDTAFLALRAVWLPRILSTCALHGVALVPLPYADYTTCYDAPARCRLESRWLKNLEDLIVEQRPSRFEKAVLAQFDGADACAWQPDAQLDVLERWCLGLGAMVQLGAQSPVDLDLSAQRSLIDEGYALTAAGFDTVQTAIDKALGGQKMRLSQSWLHAWCLQSADPEERRQFRKVMQGLSRDQGDYCLLSVTPSGRREILLDVSLTTIAQDTGRTRKWVRKVMIADRYLGADGVFRRVSHADAQMVQIRKHVIRVARSLNATEAALCLGVALPEFLRFAALGGLPRIETRAYRKPHYDRDEVQALAVALDKLPVRADNPDGPGIMEAIAAADCTLHHLTRLLTEGRLVSAVLTCRDAGVLGLRLHPTDLAQALEQSNVRDLTLKEAELALGVNEASIRKLRYTGCLPSYSLAVDSVVPRRILIQWDALQSFQARYISVKVAARQTGLTGTEIRYLARSRGLGFAPELGDLPFYPAAALLQVVAEARDEMAPASD